MYRLATMTAVLLFPALVLAGEICFGPSTIDPNGNVTATCDGVLIQNSWVGFTTSGVPCSSPDGLCPTGQETYGWTISGSSTDPFVGTGSLEAIDFVYLWLACSEGVDPNGPGVGGAAFDLIPNGLDILGFENGEDVINIGTPTQLFLALIGCRDPPFLAGMILVLTAPISVDDSSWGSVKALYR